MTHAVPVDRPEQAPVPLDLITRYKAGLDSTRFDELFDDDGRIRPHWTSIVEAVGDHGRHAIERISGRVGRLVDDHGITYNTIPGPGITGTGTVRWELDAVPYVVSAPEWDRLEAGLVQRSRLLDAVLTDLYGERNLLQRGLIPPELVFGHPGYVRAAHGITVPGPHQLFFHAVDVARFSDGHFRVTADRTQAPSGAGYALADRLVMAKAVPELFEGTGPRQLSTFARAMRLALIECAPASAEDPTVVVLSPGALSETAFDQAYLASVLGFPLVESADLVVRDGALWMRALGTLRRIDVVVRRVDDDYADPLDLRPDSHLGVVGLVEVVRRGAVTVVNTLGSGILENQALLPLLPTLGRALLDEDLLLESVETFWAGEPAGLSHIENNATSLVITSTIGRDSYIGATMTSAARSALLDRIRATPWAWTAHATPDLARAPVGPAGHRSSSEVVVPGAVGMRLFDVAQRVGYTPMNGGLAQVLVTDPLVHPMLSTAAKDIWVRSVERTTPADSTPAFTGTPPESLPRYAAAAIEGVTSPRVLSDLFWLGRYTERAEDLARVLVVAGERYQDYASRPWLDGSGALPVVLDAVTAVSATRPGFQTSFSRERTIAEFRSLTVDPARVGSLAHAVESLQMAARAVRDQLSADTWAVFSRLDSALAELGAAPAGDEAQLWATQSRVVGSTLAVSGLAAESMVRDPGWYLMDVGKRIERGLQLSALLTATLTTARTPVTERVVIESVLSATESSVTYRRRHRGRMRLAAVAELLLFDAGNPRSLIFQLDRALDGLRALPGATGTSRSEMKVERLIARLRRVDPADLESVSATGERTELAELLTTVHSSLTELANLVVLAHLTLPGETQPLWGGGGGRIRT